ncbi:hypothetical protein KA531_03155 [Candidatus Saccharibacteria bacterium]|nr:hypothetical protein [Candidatus Saccharibacteria bacterium]
MGEKKTSGGEAGKENKGCLPFVNWLVEGITGSPLTRGHKERNVKKNGKANDNKKRATQDSKDSEDPEKHRFRRFLKFRAAALVLVAIAGIGVNQCSGDDKPLADSSTSASHADTPHDDGERNGDHKNTPFEDNQYWASTKLPYIGDPRTDKEPTRTWDVGELLVIPIHNPDKLGLDPHMGPEEELVVELIEIKTVTIKEGDSPIGLVQKFNPEVSNQVVEVIVVIIGLSGEPFIEGNEATIPIFKVLRYGNTEVITIP